MKKVYICSPLGGDIKGNLEKVKRYTRYALMCGTAPVVPHFYALCLDDNIEKEREIGIVAGLGMLWFCDELWVFTISMNDITEHFVTMIRIPIHHVKHFQKKESTCGLSRLSFPLA